MQYVLTISSGNPQTISWKPIFANPPLSLPFTVLLLFCCLTYRSWQAQTCPGFPQISFLSVLSHGLSAVISGTPGHHSPVNTFFLCALPIRRRRTTMNDEKSISWKKLQEKWLTRRNLIRGAAGTALGAGLLRPKLACADDDDGDSERAECVGPNPIPGGVTGLKPFGIFIHHNPLNPTKALADISDPSQITDFDGFVGLTHIRGGGTGTDTETGVTTRLAFQADMGFSRGKFIGTDGRQHKGAFAFV
jgi:hypothetical protein